MHVDYYKNSEDKKTVNMNINFRYSKSWFSQHTTKVYCQLKNYLFSDWEWLQLK